jgi:NADPH:quinone reductase-like Zn-dependent oxidoreductase
VFGTGGDVGIRRDGTHASHVVLERAAVVEKPSGISMHEAAGIGVPFVTAYEGLSRAGLPKRGDTVLVLGANGKVGQAAIQIATRRRARVIGVVRSPEPYRGHASAEVEILDHSSVDVGQAVRDMTGGKGADIVFNTVGDPYYEAEPRRSPWRAGRSSSPPSTRSCHSTSSPSIAAAIPMSASIRWPLPRYSRQHCSPSWHPGLPMAR